MALDFPSNPTNGQVYTDGSGNRYVYNSTYGFWRANSNVSILGTSTDSQVIFNTQNQANGSPGLTFNTTSNTLYASNIAVTRNVTSSYYFGNVAYVTGIDVTVAQNAYEKANSANYYAYLVDANTKAAFNAANNVTPQITPAFTTANTAYDKANSANILAFQIGGAVTGHNTVLTTANTAYDKANAANILAFQIGGAVTGHNTVLTTANTAYDKANAANLLAFQIGGAVTGHNTVLTTANTAYDKANAANVIASNAYDEANTSVQNNVTTFIKVGYTVNTWNAGIISSYTSWTPDPANSNYQFAVNNGSATVNVPIPNCAIDVIITNGGSASALAFSASYQVQSGGIGDTYATTSGNEYLISIRRINNISTYVIKALQ